MSSEEKQTQGPNTVSPRNIEELIQYMRSGGIWHKSSPANIPKSADADFGKNALNVSVDTFSDGVINYVLEQFGVLEAESPLKTLAGFGIGILNAAREAYMLPNEYLSEFMSRNRINTAYEKDSNGGYLEIKDPQRLMHFADQSDLYAKSASGEYLPMTGLKEYMDKVESQLINTFGAGAGGFSLTALPDMLSLLNPGDETTQAYRKFFLDLRENEFQASNPMGIGKIEANVAKIQQKQVISDFEDGIYQALKKPVVTQAREYASKNSTTGVSRQVAEDWYMRGNFNEENARAVAKAMGLVKAFLPEKQPAADMGSAEPVSLSPPLTEAYGKTFGETLSIMGAMLSRLGTDDALVAARNVYDGSAAMNGVLAHAEASGALTVGSNTINNATSVHVAEVTINSAAQDLTGTGEDFGEGLKNSLTVDNALQAATI